MKENLKLDALFIGSHPDDVELICGGTFINIVKSGRKSGIVDLTRGELSTRGTLALRNKETKKATKMLCASVRENLKIKDGDIRNSFENRLKLIKIIRKYRPLIVFAPYPYDRHPDHINASNLIRESVFISGLRKISTPGFSAFRPKRVYYYRHAFDIPISFIVNISDVFYKKLEAIKCYTSQFYDKSYKKKDPDTYISSESFLKDIETRARFYGFKIGAEFGEPFYTEDFMNIDAESLFKI
ncbi:bacillithiol biosynthesis deacetylase BshB1 [bacterium]|nr:MAG: bacillithiol biosynthesis deacetylase BshB1 [bacterium]